MKVTVTQDSMSALVNSAKGFVKNDTMTPIFGFTEIFASEKTQTLRITVMNSTSGFRRQAPAKVEAKGKILIRNTEIDLIKRLVGGDITMEVHPSKKGASPKFRVSAGALERMELPLPGIDPELMVFPRFAPTPESSVPVDRRRWRETSERLLGMIRKDDPGRENLTAIHLHPQWVESTDGFRFVRLPFSLMPKSALVVPAREWPTIFQLLAFGDGEVSAYVGENNHFLWLACADGWVSYHRLCDQPFPPTDKLLMSVDADGMASSGFSKVPVQSWSIRLDRKAVMHAATTISSIFSASNIDKSLMPVISFAMSPSGVYMTLAQKSDNRATVRIGDYQPDLSKKAIERLGQLSLNADHVAKIIGVSFSSSEHVVLRWVDDGMHHPIQIEDETGAIALSTQVRA